MATCQYVDENLLQPTLCQCKVPSSDKEQRLYAPKYNHKTQCTAAKAPSAASHPPPTCRLLWKQIRPQPCPGWPRTARKDSCHTSTPHKLDVSAAVAKVAVAEDTRHEACLLVSTLKARISQQQLCSSQQHYINRLPTQWTSLALPHQYTSLAVKHFGCCFAGASSSHILLLIIKGSNCLKPPTCSSLPYTIQLHKD
jgi:hypothetical protein